RVLAEPLLGALDLLGEHLEEHELRREPLCEIGRPRDRLPRGLGTIGGDDDLHPVSIRPRTAAGLKSGGTLARCSAGSTRMTSARPATRSPSLRTQGERLPVSRISAAP